MTDRASQYRRRDQIQRIITKLEELWELQPELRLCQLISNLHMGRAPDPDHIYGTPDEVLEEWLNEAYLQHYHNTTQDPDPTS